VEWVDIGAAVQLCLIVQAARSEGVEVTVAMPTRTSSSGEEVWVDEATGVQRRARAEHILTRTSRRQAAYRFLTHLRFEGALGEPLPDGAARLRIIHDYDSASGTDEPHDSSDGSVTYLDGTLEQSYRVTCPLTWIPLPESPRVSGVAKFLGRVVAESERGLEKIDSAAIANVIVYELVENARLWSGAPTGALVAVWLRPPSGRIDIGDYLAGEGEYLEWLNSTKRQAVEIIVGDSGKGISQVLGPSYDAAITAGLDVPQLSTGRTASILQWSFDRSSTSVRDVARRGTRGLYRVDRIVTKYAGLVTVRAGDQLAGWDHGGPSHDVQVAPGQSLPFMPGSLLRLRLPPIHEEYPDRPASGGRAVPDVEYELFQVQRDAEGRLTEDCRRSLLEVSQHSGRRTCVVLAANGEEDSGSAWRALLYDLTEVRHPAALAVICLGGNWQALKLECEALNEQAIADGVDPEADGRLGHHVADPVLVLGEQPDAGEWEWVGASPDVLNALRYATRSIGGRVTKQAFASVVETETRRASVRRSLRNDPSLVTLDEDGGFSLNLSPESVFGQVAVKIREYMVRETDKAGDSEVRTPALGSTKAWIAPSDMLSELQIAPGFAIAALGLELRKADPWEGQSESHELLSDASASQSHLDTLARILGISRQETIPPEYGQEPPEGMWIVRRESAVVVYVDLIASGERIQHCLRQIIRDGGTPVAIACIVDGRGLTREPFHVWGQDVPVVSVVQFPLIVEPDGSKRVRYRAPLGRRWEDADRAELGYPISREIVTELACEQRALHFSHIGEQGGRHFTLYVDALRMLDEPTGTIRAHLLDAVAEWRANRTEPLAIWYPHSEMNLGRPAKKMADWVQSAHPEATVRQVDRPSGMAVAPSGSVPSGADVLVVDWGAVEGSTVIQMIRLAVQAGAVRVLVCIGLSQMPDDSERFLRQLGSLQRHDVPADEQEERSHQQQALFEEVRADSAVPVEVHFLGSLPVTAFSPRDCPVCQQLARLSSEQLLSGPVSEYAKKEREERLYLRKRKDTIGTDPVDFDGEDASGDSLAWMVDFRSSLQNAMYSTRAREQLVDGLKRMTSESASHSADLMRFLSLEMQWLRRPPLSFARSRELVANLAQKVAVDALASPGERASAIAVLRTCSKEFFAAYAPDIYKSVRESARGSDLPVGQLLYGIFTYCNRPYLQSSAVLDPLKDAIYAMEQWEKASAGDAPTLLEDLRALHHRVGVRASRAPFASWSRERAWRELSLSLAKLNRGRHPWPVVDWAKLSPNGAGSAIADLQQGRTPSAAAAAQLEIWRTQAPVSWAQVYAFVDNEVLPFLSVLRPILESPEAREHIGWHNADLLVLAIKNELPLRDWELGRLIETIEGDGRSIESQMVWQQYVHAYRWFDDIIMRRAGQRSPNDTGSRLLSFTAAVPAYVGATVLDCLRQFRAEDVILPAEAELPPDMNVPAFCTRDLLATTIAQILRNVLDHRDPAMDTPQVWIDFETHKRDLTLTVTNSRTRPLKRPGTGLPDLNLHLKPFHASIEGTLLPGTPSQQRPGSTWQTVLTLRRMA
jgi:hypothetical protein